MNQGWSKTGLEEKTLPHRLRVDYPRQQAAGWDPANHDTLGSG
jgi:hypothetical protein